MAVGDRSAPRNFRNNNAGNIRHGNDWLGLSEQQTDPDFCTFKTPAYGFRALVRLLRNYESKYGLKTPRQLFTRWAPPNENDTEAYVRFIATSMGVGPDDVLDLGSPETLATLAMAVARKEGGRRPDGSDWFSKADARAGVEMVLT